MIEKDLLSFAKSIVTQLNATALLVTGWAAMWETVTVLLYNLWQLMQMKKSCQKIGTMDADILPFIP